MIKNAPYQASDELLEGARADAKTWVEHDLYYDIGFFTCRYATAELVITHLLAYSSGVLDFRHFDNLCRGMDARVKIERLRKSAKLKSGIGKNLSKRLDKFEKGAIPLRNRMLHSSITHSEGGGDLTYFFSSIATPPWRELKFAPPPFTAEPPDKIRSLDLYAWGVWLSYFTKDLAIVLPKAIAGEELEIDNPDSRLQPEDHQQSPRKAPRATKRKPKQTPPE